jgi:hypothetical protein
MYVRQSRELRNLIDSVSCTHMSRFLSSEAPRLPLTNCSMSAECRCSPPHHDDSRSLPRRTQDLWSPARGGYGGEEPQLLVKPDTSTRLTGYPPK